MLGEVKAPGARLDGSLTGIETARMVGEIVPKRSPAGGVAATSCADLAAATGAVHMSGAHRSFD